MKNKKIISIVLSIILVISLTATVFIATANAKEVSITITTDKQELKSGETATVSVLVTTNFPVATMSVPVFYDKTLVDVESCETPLDYAYATATTDKTAVDSAKIYASTGIESKKYGFVLTTYIAGAGDTVAETLTETVVLNFTVTAKADVKGNAIFKVVSESAKTEDNIQGMLYFGAQPKGNVIDEIPENVENIDLTSATQNVKISISEYNLLVSEYGASMGVVVDTMSFNANGNGFVYGINTDWGEMIEDYFETPSGSVVVTPNAMGAYSTGATIELMDDNGVVVETYHFIFLGDVNGDGFVDAIDVSLVDGIANYIDFEYFGGDGTCESMAMDMNGDGFIDAIDVSAMDGIANYIDFPTQAELATKVAENKDI